MTSWHYIQAQCDFSTRFLFSLSLTFCSLGNLFVRLINQKDVAMRATEIRLNVELVFSCRVSIFFFFFLGNQAFFFYLIPFFFNSYVLHVSFSQWSLFLYKILWYFLLWNGMNYLWLRFIRLVLYRYIDTYLNWNVLHDGRMSLFEKKNSYYSTNLD